MSAQQPTESRVALAPACTIREVGELRTHLLQALPANAVILDASAVTKIDTAGVQLLLTFIRDRKRAGCQTRWAAVPDAVRAAAQRLGLCAEMQLDASAS
jgi:anti-anti-sigma regulatory factor